MYVARTQCIRKKRSCNVAGTSLILLQRSANESLSHVMSLWRMCYVQDVAVTYPRRSFLIHYVWYMFQLLIFVSSIYSRVCMAHELRSFRSCYVRATLVLRRLSMCFVEGVSLTLTRRKRCISYVWRIDNANLGSKIFLNRFRMN